MDPDSWMLLLVFGVLVLLSAYFAAAESSMVAANAIRIKNAASEGNKNAKIAERLLGRYDHMLTVILIGTNLCHLGCASVATVFAIDLFGLENKRLDYSTNTISVFLLCCINLNVYL